MSASAVPSDTPSPTTLTVTTVSDDFSDAFIAS